MTYETLEYDPPPSMTCGSNAHDFSINDSDITYDIDTDFSILQMHQNNRKPQVFRPFISKEKTIH